MSDLAISRSPSLDVGPPAQVVSSDFMPASGRGLPRELDIAINHHFMIRPEFTSSDAGARRTSSSLLSCDSQLIKYWHARLKATRWLLDLTASEIAVVKINFRPGDFSRDADHLKCFRDTLHFHHGNSLFALFRVRLGMRAQVGCLNSASSTVLIPPSLTPSGTILHYEDDSARVGEIEELPGNIMDILLESLCMPAPKQHCAQPS